MQTKSWVGERSIDRSLDLYILISYHSIYLRGYNIITIALCFWLLSADLCLLCLSSELAVAHDLWPGVLCRGDDAHGGASLRHGPFWSRLQSQSQTSRRHDCGRDSNQQNGPSSEEGEGFFYRSTVAGSAGTHTTEQAKEPLWVWLSRFRKVPSLLLLSSSSASFCHAHVPHVPAALLWVALVHQREFIQDPHVS